MTSKEELLFRKTGVQPSKEKLGRADANYRSTGAATKRLMSVKIDGKRFIADKKKITIRPK